MAENAAHWPPSRSFEQTVVTSRASVSGMRFREACGSIGRWLLPAASLGAVCAFSAKSLAAETRSPAARDVATEGFSAFEAGRYEEANEKLSRALDLVGVPTMALYAARTNVKLKHWVKASELYLLASRLSPKSAADITQLQAQHEAEKERAALLLRVPRLTIELKGEESRFGAGFFSTRNPSRARCWSQPARRSRTPRDPRHTRRSSGHGRTRCRRAAAQDDDALFRPPRTAGVQQLYAAEYRDEHPIAGCLCDPFSDPTDSSKESTPVAPNSPTATGTATRVVAGSSASPTGPRRPTDNLGEGAETSDGIDNTTTRTLGWVGVGIGGVGLLVGVTTGLMATSARSKLLESGDCRDSLCQLETRGDVDRYNSLRTWSTIGFVAGGLFAAAGATVLLTVPKETNDLQAQLVVGPGTAAVVGSF